MFSHKPVIIVKHCELTMVTDGSEDLLIHFLKPNQHCAACLQWLKGLRYVLLQEREYPFESLTRKYTGITKEDHFLTSTREKLNRPPN